MTDEAENMVIDTLNGADSISAVKKMIGAFFWYVNSCRPFR